MCITALPSPPVPLADMWYTTYLPNARPACRLDEAEGVWSVIVTSAAPLLCTGVFELTVTQGTVEVGGAHICAGDTPVAISPSDTRAVTQISAVQTDSLRCLAQLPAASATLLLRALSADCAVGPVDGPLASASLCQEHAIPAAWSEVCIGSGRYVARALPTSG